MNTDWLDRIINYIPVLLSLSFHEWAHARAAWSLGDDTAKREGRLTLNPFSHLDFLGSLLPLLGVPFGWAKPVPVNPVRFTRRVTMPVGMAITAAAGPLANIFLALVITGVIFLLRLVVPNVLSSIRSVIPWLSYSVLINLSLAAFNLLPLYPLDGSRVVNGLLPYRWRNTWEKFVPLSPYLLVLFVFGLPYLGISPFQWVVDIAQFLVAFALEVRNE